MSDMIGNFSGVTLTDVDPETGFLIKSNHAVRDVDVRDSLGRFVSGVAGYEVVPVFTVAKKLEVLNRLYDLWPDVSLACRLSGISRQTFTNHVNVDKSFAECVREFENKAVDGIEGFRFRIAQTPGGALDRMAVLNAYRRERYNPKTEIEIKHTMTPQEARDSIRRMEQAVDAEVIETVQRIKAKNRGQLAPKTKSHE